MDKVTIHDLHRMKTRGEPISMLTAYDYPTALLLDQSGIDVILVGDSAGMVVHGFETTLPVTMDMMVMHCQAVRRGAKRAFLIGDMPFMSYQTSLEDARRNAGRLLVEGGMDAVKLEGGQHMAGTIRELVAIGIAVQGHIGLTPQSVSQLGGFKVQGKTVEAARQLLDDARALEAAGAFSMVLEAIPARLAELITRSVGVPTISIGAGAGCDGQVLVTHDVLGLFDRFTPKFVKQFANVADTMRGAFEMYQAEVRSRTFPGAEHQFTMPDDVWDVIQSELE
ncbi:MAG: 3-methyl-2-oxobutanoate hydroxymethyltransferase [Anaerolineae bacterium]|nr:3-methyl-2-oxobutanoate hydroxymethyltransferase [Anaerolineae bacterium]